MRIGPPPDECRGRRGSPSSSSSGRSGAAPSPPRRRCGGWPRAPSSDHGSGTNSKRCRDAGAIQRNVKATRLVEFLRSTDEKALVFTQYLRTLQHLQRVLEAEGHRVALYHGGLPPAAKDRAVRSFQGDRQVFLSTEAGGE